ncbi:MAG TPA: hypothetical protein VFV79_02920 [Saprospiraceae bacterium]|nr:hypothetical protein [Saprospiraceae bacterium]
MVKILENTFRNFLPAILLLLSLPISGQSQKKAMLLDFSYGFNFPLGDMQDRFGESNVLGAGLESISYESKVSIGIDGGYFFGNTVKEDVLLQLRSGDGNIIGINGLPGDVSLKERGYFMGAHAGKIFSTTDQKSSLTGIRTQLGIGFIQHKIRIQDNQNNIVPLNKEYLQGYDRLTNGAALRLAAGYQYDSPLNNFHFKIMGDVTAARTQSRRDLDYATGTYLGEKRTDILLGVSVSYVVMISRAQTSENIYY